MTVLEMINAMPIFQCFTDLEKKAISKMDHKLVEFKKGETIIQEGDQSRSLYVLLKGNVLITKASNGANIRLSKLTPGEIFGEMSLFTDTPRRTNVVANENGVALKIDDEFLEKLDPVAKNKIKDYLICVLIKRLDQMNDSIMTISKSLRH